MILLFFFSISEDQTAAGEEEEEEEEEGELLGAATGDDCTIAAFDIDLVMRGGAMAVCRRRGSID